MERLFLVLEPGNHMYLVIEAARRLGFTVVACHCQPLAPPAPFDRALASVSHFVQVDGWRAGQGAFAAIVAWCGDRPVAGTYAGYETTLEANARLRQHFGLPGSAPAQVAFLLDKLAVRTWLRDASLSRLRVVGEPALRGLTAWPFPGRAAFLKPVNGSGSIYVRRCSSLADVREHLAEWDGDARPLKRFAIDHLKAGRGLFLEEEAVGELLSVEGYCQRGELVAIGITDRTVLARDVAVEMGNTFPCPHPRRDAILDRARAIHACLGIADGPTHTELIVPADGGDIELVELNARFAGGDILLLIDHALGIRFEDDLVRLATGEAPAPLPAQPARYVSGQDFLAPAHVRRFDSIAIPGDDVVFQKLVVRPGTALTSTGFQSDHVAAFVVAADTYAGALARASEIRAATAINGAPLGDDPNNRVIHCARTWLER
jgi:biotin carboxylase